MPRNVVPSSFSGAPSGCRIVFFSVTIYNFTPCRFLDHRFAGVGGILAALGRVFRSDPPLNPLLGGDLGCNPQGTRIWNIVSVKLYIIAFFSYFSSLRIPDVGKGG